MSGKDTFGKNNPIALQYFITIIVMIAISTAGYLVGRDKPIPNWIERYLIPALGWLGLILILIVVVDWLKNRFGGNQGQPDEGDDAEVVDESNSKP